MDISHGYLFYGYMNEYTCWIYIWIRFQYKLDGYVLISIKKLRISVSDTFLGHVMWIYSGVSKMDINMDILITIGI